MADINLTTKEMVEKADRVMHTEEPMKRAVASCALAEQWNGLSQTERNETMQAIHEMRDKNVVAIGQIDMGKGNNIQGIEFYGNSQQDGVTKIDWNNGLSLRVGDSSKPNTLDSKSSIRETSLSQPNTDPLSFLCIVGDNPKK